ncbi:hypothetical protein EST38_g3240 [Candolleomyces aberdarensis]|uniref:Nephrocystin 3-like N-terminal domain-containing protein n=1 Tax=Candolleomyces aberdarensis TaxID=2316362 RepID=A0A4V1Q4M6_9AGAR|nr:hypothetical protein EST38_g3240 [Candolleomyces aberdarensis]
MVNYHVEGGFQAHVSVNRPEQRSLFDVLQPIIDASHTRDRKRSPPDSSCFPGTRIQVVKNVNSWAKSEITTPAEPHEVCDTSDREDRPVISFFFFRNAGDRSRIWRLATTLASQMAGVIPQTEPFIREAVQANPVLLMADEGGPSLRARMRCLVYAPFKAVVQRKKRVRALTQSPLLMALDGLDECDNKDEVQELIDGMLEFFNENPLIPLRVFITSRVEQHIQSRLNVPAVKLDNLADHCSDDDITTFLHILFEDGCRWNPVVQSYVQQHGEWPTKSDRRKLVKHIGGSFIFASVVFQFIMTTNTETNDLPTPMDRLPLALKMNPGLDGLYTQTLARSKHLPHFPDIISTIALLVEPLPTSGIAELLGIHTYEVVNALVNLQAIIQVPGTDNIPVTFCHTSFRDFLTTQSRSGGFFAHLSHHVRLFLRCLECQLKHLRQDPEFFIRSRVQISAVAHYAREYSYRHLYRGRSCFKLSEFNPAIQMCREGLALQPGTPELIENLASVVRLRAHNTRSLMDWDEAISLSRAVLELHPSPDPNRSNSFGNLGNALLDRYCNTCTTADLDEAISLYREALELLLPSHPGRSASFNNLGNALAIRHRGTGTMADLDEAISLLREALEPQTSLDPDRSALLNDLGVALVDRHRRTGAMTDLDEAIFLHHEALELRPFSHPDRSASLNALGCALLDRHRSTGTMTDLDEAISLHREALELRPSPHPERSASLNNLGNALMNRHQRTRTMSDFEEAISLHREALELRPSPHPDRLSSLNTLGNALQARHRHTGMVANLEEAISLFYKALELRPSPHSARSFLLHNLIISLQAMYEETHALSHLQEAIVHSEELLEFHYTVGHHLRAGFLLTLGSFLQIRFDATRREEDLSRIMKLKEEANQLSALSPEPAP